MKLTRLIPGILVFAAAVSIVRADGPFVTPDEVDFKSLLIPPPAEGSIQETLEIDALLGLQEHRTDADVKRISSEVKMTPFIFSQVLGSWFNPDDLPTTATFLKQVMTQAGAVSSKAKDAFGRRRPFLVDPRIKPCVAEENTFSYPSGHSTRSMVLALTLAEIFPDQKDAIIARARLIGDDREMAGEHFPSDVEAGRVLAKAIFQKMSENPDFKAEIEKVQEECLAKEKKN
jgi:acid phosphatase (class A)